MSLSDESDCHPSSISGARLATQVLLIPATHSAFLLCVSNLHCYSREVKNLTRETSSHKWVEPRACLIATFHFQCCWAVNSSWWGCCEHLQLPSSEGRQKLHSPLKRSVLVTLSVTALRKSKPAGCLLLNIIIILMDIHYRCTSSFLMIS